MKVDFLRKAKWYIVGFILIAVMLSVSLSFSAWDSLSFKAIMNANGGDFKEKPPAPVWSDYIKLVDDRYPVDAPNKQIDVGDIVTYGNFYQTANATEPTEPLKWIVVNIDKDNVATLLTEQIVVSGNFWGQYKQYYQNYYQSTVRSWLNSGQGSLQGSGANWDDAKRDVDNARSDGLSWAGATGNIGKGFLNVAFTDGARKLLVPKRITGMSGYRKNTTAFEGEYKTNDNKNYVNDLVWLPSYQEIYGGTVDPWGKPLTDPGYTKFEYFANNEQRKATLTGYASGSNSNYSANNGTSIHGASQTWWWLRSPDPSYYYASLMVNTGGGGTGATTSDSYGGVRPAVCVQL